MPSESMEPTLHQGQSFVVDTGYYAQHAIQDGDLVTVRYEGQLLVKRVLATSGETLEGRQGVVWRNGRMIPEPYLPKPDLPQPDEFGSFPAQRLAAGTLFLAGDNRLHSLDSRSSEFGPITVQDVVGRVLLQEGEGARDVH